MHPKIIKYWERFGVIQAYDDNSWELVRLPDKFDIIIAFIRDGKVKYYRGLVGPDVLSEKEMLSYIKLQVFL